MGGKGEDDLNQRIKSNIYTSNTNLDLEEQEKLLPIIAIKIAFEHDLL